MYYIEQNNKIVLFDKDKQKLIDTLLFMPQYAGLEIKETERPIEDFQFADTDEYKEVQAKKERNRLDLLSLTKREVFLGLYQAKGITPEQIKAQISAPAALIEFEYANDYFRGNPLINTVGQALGITSDQLDKFFDETKNGDTEAYKYLTTVTLTINPTPSDATVTINSEAKNTVTVPYGDTVEYSVAAEGYLTQSGTVELTEDTTLDIELVKEGVNEGGIEEPPIEEETAEEENVNNENDYSQNEGENVNNEVEDENTTDTTTDTNNGDEVEAEPTGDVDKE